jgi:4-amino-4-deoxy-L-arabinose transferase-like glycosyltransferase
VAWAKEESISDISQSPEVSSDMVASKDDFATSTTIVALARAKARKAAGRLREADKRDLLSLTLILVVAAVLRFDRLPDATLWLGDQARDASIVMQNLAAGHIPELGPPASIGTYFRGPAYYILLMPSFWMGGGNPAFGAAFVALLDLGTVVLIYLLGARWLGPSAGLMAATVWAVSPVAVYWARLMWQPDLVPFFTVLCFYSLARTAKDGRWLIVLAASLSLAWQCHDQALLLVPPLAISVIVHIRRFKPWHFVAAFVVVVATLATYLNHERHVGWQDLVAMANYILHGTAAAGTPNTLSWSDRVVSAFNGAVGVLPGPPARLPLLLLVAAGFVVLCHQLWTRRGPGELAITAWVAVLPLYAFWRGMFDTYYLMILLPLVALMLAGGVWAVARLGRVPAAAVSVFVVVCVVSTGITEWTTVSTTPLSDGNLATTRAIVGLVRQQAGGQPFAFQLVSYAAGSDSYTVPYGYLLERDGQSPARQVDVPTVVVFDPADPAYPHAANVNGIGVVWFPAPALGANIAGGSLDASAGWDLPSGTQSGSDGATSFLEMDGTPNGPITPEGRNASRTVPVTAGQDYVLSFRSRLAEPGGAQRVYGQVLDAQGYAIGVFPDSGGYTLESGADWSEGSFYLQIPPNGASVRIDLRNTGRQPMFVESVELRPVVSAPIPGQPVLGW